MSNDEKPGMPNTKSPFSPWTRSHRFQTQIDKVESVTTRVCDDERAFEQFDAETEGLSAETFGPTDERGEAYKYAVLGDAEHMVNLPDRHRAGSARRFQEGHSAVPSSAEELCGRACTARSGRNGVPDRRRFGRDAVQKLT
ncbi:hypothetical protein [Nitrospira sp. Nam74]